MVTMKRSRIVQFSPIHLQPGGGGRTPSLPPSPPLNYIPRSLYKYFWFYIEAPVLSCLISCTILFCSPVLFSCIVFQSCSSVLSSWSVQSFCSVLSSWSGLVWSGLIWSGLVWSGLVWSGLVWSGLVWSGLVCLFFPIPCFLYYPPGLFCPVLVWSVLLCPAILCPIPLLCSSELL